MENNNGGGAMSCRGCGNKTYFANAQGHCEDCSSVCYYCLETQHASGMHVEVIDHKSGTLMAHRTCHSRAQMTE